MLIMNGSYNSVAKQNQHVIDDAWDKFSEYIGEYNLQTPLSYQQFEEIFEKLNKDGIYTNYKKQILKSFRYDSYSWPLVEREENTLK